MLIHHFRCCAQLGPGPLLADSGNACSRQRNPRIRPWWRGRSPTSCAPDLPSLPRTPSCASSRHPPARCQAAARHPARSRAAGAPGQPRPGLAVAAAARAAGYAAALAPPVVSPLLAVAIPGRGPGAPPGPRARDDRPHPGDGGDQPSVGRGAHPWRAPEAGHPLRQVGHPALPARVAPVAPRPARDAGTAACRRGGRTCRRWSAA